MKCNEQERWRALSLVNQQWDSIDNMISMIQRNSIATELHTDGLVSDYVTCCTNENIAIADKVLQEKMARLFYENDGFFLNRKVMIIISLEQETPSQYGVYGRIASIINMVAEVALGKHRITIYIPSK